MVADGTVPKGFHTERSIIVQEIGEKLSAMIGLITTKKLLGTANHIHTHVPPYSLPIEDACRKFVLTAYEEQKPRSNQSAFCCQKGEDRSTVLIRKWRLSNDCKYRI